MQDMNMCELDYCPYADMPQPCESCVYYLGKLCLSSLYGKCVSEDE
jgi:hypothetical protein